MRDEVCKKARKCPGHKMHNDFNVSGLKSVMADQVMEILPENKQVDSPVFQP
jgi:hypothetical protein